jgi:hypothetical protein
MGKSIVLGVGGKTGLAMDGTRLGKKARNYQSAKERLSNDNLPFTSPVFFAPRAAANSLKTITPDHLPATTPRSLFVTKFRKC